MFARVATTILGLAGVSQVNGYTKFGEYMPVSSVLEHAQISLDVAAFNDALKGDNPDYAAALDIYTLGGGNSCKSPVKRRTLQDFATKDLTGESFHDRFVSSGFQIGFWDSLMLAALQGTGAFDGMERVKRVTTLKKAVLGLVTYYASHELEAAIEKAEVPETRSDAKSGHAWDEGWAFYFGASSDGSASPWEVSKKRDENFPDGLQVHTAIVPHFNQGLIAVRNETYDDAVAKVARDTIYKMWAITYIRAALKYLEISEHTYSTKAHAEGYAYYMAIDGWVHSYSSEAATAMRSALDITKTEIGSGSFCDAKAKMEAAYQAMGITCEQVGTFVDATDPPCEATTTCAAIDVAPFGDGAQAVDKVTGTSTNVDCPITEDNVDGAHGLASPVPLVTALVFAVVGILSC